MNTYTRSDLITDLANKQGVTQAEAQSMIDAALSLICEKLAAGQDVSLRRFGSFVLRVSRPRVGRNPNNPGVAVQIPARVAVKFQPGGELKGMISSLRPGQVQG